VAKNIFQRVLSNLKAGGNISVGDVNVHQTNKNYSLIGGPSIVPAPFIVPEIDWDRAMQILEQEMQPKIKKRLKDSLFGLADIAIVEVKSVRHEDSPALELEAVETGSTQADMIAPHSPIIETYEREYIKGKLLILGSPGAGKTITLLKLAEQLVGQAIDNPKTVIPIIFELSTWREGQTIEAWLIEQLYENHGGNRKARIYETWVERRVLLPLLDGLNKLGMVRQQKCTVALNEFAKVYPYLVVCCRMKEFQQSGVDLAHLRGKVQLQPLSDGQIRDYLGQLGKSGLWAQMQAVPEIGQLLEPVIDPEYPEHDEPGLLRVPLFISWAAQVYDPKNPLRDKNELLYACIERQLSLDTENRHLYRNKNTIKNSLNWLAKQLDERDDVVFRVERLQVDWIEHGLPRKLYRATMVVILAVLFGLLGIGIFGINIASFLLVMAGILYGLLYDVEMARDINLTARINSMRRSLAISKEHVENILMCGILTFISSSFITTIFRQGSTSITLMSSFFLGGLLGFLEKSNKIYCKDTRNTEEYLVNSTAEMLRKSTRIILIFFIIIFLASVFLMQILINEKLTVFSFIVVKKLMLASMMLSLTISFSYSGMLSLLQLISIRIVLTCRGKIPLGFRNFLDECTEKYLLCGSDGQYKFTHTELREYFSKVYPKNEP
jgi:DNA polymerase III delta prime subunit